MKATIFASHWTSLLKTLDTKKFELAIHPNFLKGGKPEQIIEELKLLYPQAVGVRAHSVFIHSRLFQIYEKYGLRYSSDYLLYMQPNVSPVPIYNMIQLPIYFMDNLHLEMRVVNEKIFEIESLQLKSNGLKVFDFHPIHLFLNTATIAQYESIKNYYHQPKKLENYRNTGKGIRSLFIALLDYINESQVQTYTLNEISDSWKFSD